MKKAARSQPKRAHEPAQAKLAPSAVKKPLYGA